jgi:rhamnopyranosyl-N-acetylglucosaminyl-diphospho-decaprenol beta-1,3/1,4-galactofuranosyltransferase
MDKPSSELPVEGGPLHPDHGAERRVCAVVVTFNRRELLTRCLRALRAQVGASDRVLVVDNASSDGTAEMLAADFPEVCVLRLPTNTGGAGGFHAGTKKAFEDGYRYAWLMDDDGHPAPDCLEKLLEHAAPNRVLVPAQQEDNGRLYGFIPWSHGGRDVTDEIVKAGGPVSGRFVFTFVGPFVGRGVIEKVGLPNADFFIWFDDFEYALRIHHHKRLQIVALPQARFFHNIAQQKVRDVSLLGRKSERSLQPVRRVYYGTRNYLYILRTQAGHRRDLARFLMAQFKALAGDILYEEERWACARARLSAVRDGLTGNLGKRNL